MVIVAAQAVPHQVTRAKNWVQPRKRKNRATLRNMAVRPRKNTLQTTWPKLTRKGKTHQTQMKRLTSQRLLIQGNHLLKIKKVARKASSNHSPSQVKSRAKAVKAVKRSKTAGRSSSIKSLIRSSRKIQSNTSGTTQMLKSLIILRTCGTISEWVLPCHPSTIKTATESSFTFFKGGRKSYRKSDFEHFKAL